ncbi:MAG TPA: alpha/beta hydrolase [Acidimicrobiia bacterium]|nr:alpha/beta hydrolase [Acidimicrobiia bacterium]
MTGSEARVRMLAGLPITERVLDVGGIETTVLEAGDGPSLVLLHGGIECGGAYWAPVIARLAERHRLVVPDVPGLGESAPVDRLDDDTFAEWLAGVLEQMHAEQPALVAHSLLGSAAARFAARRSDLLRGLVVYGAPGVGPYRMPMRLRYVAIRFGIRPSPRNAERFDRFALLDLDANRRRDPEWFAAFDEYARSRGTVPHVKRTMRRLISAETKQIPDVELGRIAVPTTLLWGRHDRMVPLALAQGAAERLGWPLHVVDGAAHAPHMEQPEAFAAVLSTIADAPSERSA